MNRQKLATILGAISIVCILGLAGILFLNTKSPLVQDPMAARVSQEEEKAKLTDLTIGQWSEQAEAEKAPEEFEGTEEDERPETSSEDFGNFTIDFEKASAEAEKAQDLEKSRQEGLDSEPEASKEMSASPASRTSKGKNKQVISVAQNKNKAADQKQAPLVASSKEKAEPAQKKAPIAPSLKVAEDQEKAEEKLPADQKKKTRTRSADPSKDSKELLSDQTNSKDDRKKDGSGTDAQRASDEAAEEKAAIEKALESIQEQKKTIKLEDDSFSEMADKASSLELDSQKAPDPSEEKSGYEGDQENPSDDPLSLLDQIKKNEENLSESPSKALAPQSLYTLSYLKQKGVIVWNGYRFTYYSQTVLPGNKLTIPGRHVNAAGFVADGSGNIVIAYGGRRGDVIPTPFGFWGKIYDYCETPGTYDCYVK